MRLTRRMKRSLRCDTGAIVNHGCARCAEKNQRDNARTTIFTAAYTGTSQGTAVGAKRVTLHGTIGRKSIAFAERAGSPTRRPPAGHPGCIRGGWKHIAFLTIHLPARHRRDRRRPRVADIRRGLNPTRATRRSESSARVPVAIASVDTPHPRMVSLTIVTLSIVAHISAR